MARLGESHLISSSSAWRSLAASGEGAFELGLRSFLDSRGGGGASWISLFRTAGVPLGLGPLCEQFLFVALDIYTVGFFFSFRAYPLA